MEQRFHEIANRPGSVLLEFHEGKVGERIEWSLSGVDEGDCYIKLIGGDPSKVIPQRKYHGNEHADTSEISDLMRRAGNLLIPHNHQNIWEGADLFLAITVKKQRYYICTERDRTFFPNAGRTLGVMAGQMILENAKSYFQEADWPADKERDGRKVLEKLPSMTVKTFCRELEIADPIGGKLFHHIRGTTARKRNRN